MKKDIKREIINNACFGVCFAITGALFLLLLLWQDDNVDWSLFNTFLALVTMAVSGASNSFLMYYFCDYRHKNSEVNTWYYTKLIIISMLIAMALNIVLSILMSAYFIIMVLMHMSLLLVVGIIISFEQKKLGVN